MDSLAPYGQMDGWIAGNGGRVVDMDVHVQGQKSKGKLNFIIFNCGAK